MERKPGADEASGIRHQASDPPVGVALTRRVSDPLRREAETSDEASRIRDQASGDENAGAVIGRLPEAEVSKLDNKTKKRIARLEGLRRWMLVLAALLLLGGYAVDILPVLYASAIPLAVALLVTYLIKWTEEKAGKEEVRK
jgi:hypothetical protein